MTLVKFQDGIAWLKINREEKLNALNKALLSELNERFTALYHRTYLCIPAQYLPLFHAKAVS